MKTALRYMVKAKIAPQSAWYRQDTFATDRTQQRKRPSTAKVRQVEISDSTSQ